MTYVFKNPNAKEQRSMTLAESQTYVEVLSRKFQYAETRFGLLR